MRPAASHANDTTMHAVIIVLIAVILADPAFAAQQTPVSVAGEGSAPGLGPAARSAAIADAQTSIVLDRLDKIAPSRDYSIFAPILRAAPDYFRSYKLVKESKTEDATRVEIEGELLDRKLNEDIASIALAQEFVTPRIVIIAHEELTPPAEPNPDTPGILEKKLHEDLKRIQFEIVGPAALRERIPVEKWRQFLDESAELAAIFAREMIADVVVLASGTTHLEDAKADAKLHRVRANVSFRIVRVADGYVLDSPKAEAVVNCADTAAGSAQAIEDACGKLIDDAKTAVALGALSGAPDNALTVTIEKISDDQQATEVIAAIKRCLGAEQHEVIYRDTNRVRVRIPYTGPIGRLADCVPGLVVTSHRLALKTVLNRDVTLVMESTTS